VVSGTLQRRHGDDNTPRQSPRSGNGRKRALESDERPRREPAKRARSAAPVACDPLAGHRLDLSGAPSVLFVGQAIPAKRAAVYEGLLASGALPVIPYEDADNASGYLQRSLSVLEKKYADAPFSVSVAGVCAADSADRVGRERQHDLVAVTVMVEGGCVWVDAVDFDAEMRRLDPLLSASIFHHLGRATRWTYDAFTPGNALGVAEWLLFDGDAREWWDQLPYTMADDRQAAEAITPLQIRRYLRVNEIRTPGFVKRSIGSHHARLTAPLPSEECSKRLSALPETARTLAERLLDATRRLERIATALETPMTVDDHAIMENDEVVMAQPGLVIETGSNNMVHEVLEESWQYAAQSEGFGLNYAFVLRAEEAAYRRFEQSLALFHEASAIVDGIAWAFSEFSQREETDPREDGDSREGS